MKGWEGELLNAIGQTPMQPGVFKWAEYTQSPCLYDEVFFEVTEFASLGDSLPSTSVICQPQLNCIDLIYCTHPELEMQFLENHPTTDVLSRHSPGDPTTINKYYMATEPPSYRLRITSQMPGSSNFLVTTVSGHHSISFPIVFGISASSSSHIELGLNWAALLRDSLIGLGHWVDSSFDAGRFLTDPTYSNSHFPVTPRSIDAPRNICVIPLQYCLTFLETGVAPILSSVAGSMTSASGNMPSGVFSPF
ncbi:hypothetical protein B0H13DRAFT_1904492 [Mycena leptocephala]|nr:hypothetical protein B0H13DRAFT_1904492 [Mycena leptocephala]